MGIPSSNIISDFLRDHGKIDPTSLRLKFGSQSEFASVIDHLESMQKNEGRWPRVGSTPGYLFPPLRNAQQGSSEVLADWKAQFLNRQLNGLAGKTLWDATGGSGIDLWSFLNLGARCRTTEPDSKMAALLSHNAEVLGHQLEVMITPAEEAIPREVDIIYCDPSRMVNGRRTTHPSDCHPNVIALMSTWNQLAKHLLFKLSPMLDRKEAERLFPGADLIWLSHRREVKELLIWSSPLSRGEARAIELDDLGGTVYDIRSDQSPLLELSDAPLAYLLDPDPVIVASRTVHDVALEFGLKGLSPMHNLLTTSDLPDERIPGRIFRVESHGKPSKKEFKKGFTIISRGFPAKADELRARFSCSEHEQRVLIASSWGSNTQNFIQCSRIQRNLK